MAHHHGTGGHVPPRKGTSNDLFTVIEKNGRTTSPSTPSTSNLIGIAPFGCL